jgi:hypothetical protein
MNNGSAAAGRRGFQDRRALGRPVVTIADREVSVQWSDQSDPV